MKTTSHAIFWAVFLSLSAIAPLRAGEVDLSTVVPKDDVEKLLGGDIGVPTAHHDESANGVQSKLGYRCAGTRKTLLLAVIQTKPGSPTPEQRLAILTAGESRLQSVRDIGNNAVFFDSGLEENSKTGRLTMLYVARGATFVSVGLGGFADAKAALVTEKEIAQKILAQL